jgi:hypothetical protein
VEAERQLLELLRGEDVPEFDVRVRVRAGHWFVRLSTPEVGRPPDEGGGKSFSEAWRDVKPCRG